MNLYGAKGSPPRVRGKVDDDALRACRGGITPACAGKRAPFSSPTHHLQDHPRVCGEKITRRARPVPALGSPPRVRGKDALKMANPAWMRITPACAGKRRITGGNARLDEDHPRVCGEKFFTLSMRFLCMGSPPRVRGKGHAA